MSTAPKINGSNAARVMANSQIENPRVDEEGLIFSTPTVKGGGNGPKTTVHRRDPTRVARKGIGGRWLMQLKRGVNGGCKLTRTRMPTDEI
jgi:hypothetical protein